MAITYTWAVTGLKATQVGTANDYVVQTYWTKTGTDEAGNTGTFSGATPLDPNPTQTDFVPYEQLTQEVVIEWIKPLVTGSYEDHVNGVIAKQIAEKIVPIKQPPLPWVPVETTPPATPTP